MLDPKVKAEIGKAGSLTFTILPTHPLYDSIQPFVTFMRVVIDEAEVFYGRVLDISRDLYNQKSVTCEGDLAFLLDSVCEPGNYEESPTAFLRRAIGWHNNQVEAAKKLTMGTVSARLTMRNTSVKFDISSYERIADVLETELIGYYGGYLRTRNQNGTRYLDWVQEGDSESDQVVEYGSQLLDLTHDENANDLFTIILAVGDSNSENGEDYNFPTYRYEVPGAVAKYGRITHVESYSGISDTAKLKSLAEEYAKTHYDPYPTELRIKAVDLHILDPGTQTILTGDTVTIRSTPHSLSKSLMCVSIDYDLPSPEETEYVFGHPKQTLSQRYTKEKKEQEAATSKAAKSAGRAGGAGKKNAEDLAVETKERITDIEKLTATAAALQIYAQNIELYAKNVSADLDEFKVTANRGILEAKTMDIATERLNIDSVAEGVVSEINARRSLSSFGYMDISQLTVGNGGLTCNSYVRMLGNNVTWQNVEVVTGISVSHGRDSHIAKSYNGSTVGGYTSLSYVSGVSKSTQTLHYLGRS